MNTMVAILKSPIILMAISNLFFAQNSMIFCVNFITHFLTLLKIKFNVITESLPISNTQCYQKKL